MSTRAEEPPSVREPSTRVRSLLPAVTNVPGEPSSISTLLLSSSRPLTELVPMELPAAQVPATISFLVGSSSMVPEPLNVWFALMVKLPVRFVRSRVAPVLPAVPMAMVPPVMAPPSRTTRSPVTAMLPGRV